MDHETDHGEMAAKEAELRARLRLPNSLIDRATKTRNSKPRRGKAAA
jgi:hypothetical protein